MYAYGIPTHIVDLIKLIFRYVDNTKLLHMLLNSIKSVIPLCVFVCVRACVRARACLRLETSFFGYMTSW